MGDGGRGDGELGESRADEGVSEEERGRVGETAEGAVEEVVVGGGEAGEEGDTGAIVESGEESELGSGGGGGG